MKSVFVWLFALVLLSGCSATSTVIKSEKERELHQAVQQYPNDTQALLDLTQYQLEQYDKSPEPKALLPLLANLNKLVDKLPNNRMVVYRYYRLNLLQGIAQQSYDVDRWNAFYQQHPFLSTIDLAPPDYIPVLLEQVSGAAKIAALQRSLRANPNFVAPYRVLAEMYYVADKAELAIYLLNAAANLEKDQGQSLAMLNYVRMEQIEAKMCEWDMSASTQLAFTEAKQLTKLNPKYADFQFRLANIMRHLGKFPLSVFSAKKAAALDPQHQSFLLESYFWNNNLDKVYAEIERSGRERIDSWSLHVIIYSYLVEGKWQAAANLTEHYITRPEYSFYGVLYGSYGYLMLDQAERARTLLNSGLNNLTLSSWQHSMLAFAQGQLEETALLQRAGNRCEESEGRFLLALDKQLRGDEAGRQAEFNKILALDVKAFFEYAAARNMLKRMQQSRDAFVNTGI